MLGWMYTLFFVFLGSSAALWGGWLERAGPRKAGVVSAFCWCGGLVISALGVMLHQIWMLWLGSGVIGGIGLGLGYISPVSTLIKWFPDRRGMATGMAIMGFGGGAMIGAPLADKLMKYFATPTSVGVWADLPHAGRDLFRLHDGRRARLSRAGRRTGSRPAGTPPERAAKKRMITDRHVHLDVGLEDAAVLAGLGRAVPQRHGRHRHHRHGLADAAGSLRRQADRRRRRLQRSRRGAERRRSPRSPPASPACLSLFNIGGRFFWASLSDQLGRKMTYSIFFLLGFALYAAIPGTGRQPATWRCSSPFFCIILSMYGGGFATVPAYLADMFGTKMVGAIHGRLLTAWSAAGVLGPVLVNYIREYQLDHGVARAEAYTITMYILAGLLVIGFVCNWLVKSVAEQHYMTDEELQEEKTLANDTHQHFVADVEALAVEATHNAKVFLAWLAVWIPLGWGIWMTLQKATVLFK